MKSQKISTILRVTGGHPLTGMPCQLEEGEYVPLQWLGYDEVLGAGFVRLGNYSTTLLEIAVAPYSQVVNGLSITSIDIASPWPEFSVTETFDGLSTVSTSFEGWRVVDLEEDFYVSTRQDEILVFWGELGACEACVFGRVRFLGNGGILVGVLLTGFTEEETTLFLSHAQRDRRRIHR